MALWNVFLCAISTVICLLKLNKSLVIQKLNIRCHVVLFFCLFVSMFDMIVLCLYGLTGEDNAE